MHELPQHLLLHLPESCASLNDAQLVRWGRGFTPLINIVRHDQEGPHASAVMHLDCTGCGHLFGDEYTMARRVLEGLQRDFDCTTRAVLAGTAAVAEMVLAVASNNAFDEGLLCLDAGNQAAIIDTLPLRGLVRSPAVLQRLHEVGFEQVADALAAVQKDPKNFVSRYGTDFVQHVRCVLGEHPQRRPLDCPGPPKCSVLQVFDGPLRCTQTIALAVNALLAQLMDTLRSTLHGVEVLQVRLERPRQDDLVHTVRFTSPTRNVRHVRSVLAPKLERMDPGEDGAESVRLIAVEHVGMGHLQHVVWGDDAQTNAGTLSAAASQLVDVLQQRCTVTRRLPNDGHVPQAMVCAPRLAMQAVDRPSRLFEQPAQVHVELPASGTGVLVWKRRRFVIVEACGPECIAEPWWEHPKGEWATREYWRVQRSDGQWLWVYQLLAAETQRSTFGDQHSNPWFLHGAWT